jgi:hypothetical protein
VVVARELLGDDHRGLDFLGRAAAGDLDHRGVAVAVAAGEVDLVVAVHAVDGG